MGPPHQGGRHQQRLSARAGEATRPRAAGRRPGMVLLADQRDPVVPDADDRLDDPDAQPADVAGQRRSVVRDGAVGARQILGIVAGNALQHDRAILDRPGHRAGMVEAVGVGVDPGPADEAIGRLQSDDAAQRRRAADRSAGIRAERAGDEAGRHRGARAARRAAGEMLAGPGVARRRPGQVE